MSLLHKEVKLALLFSMIATCQFADAAVMGSAKVMSGLGEPLNIQIPVTNIDPKLSKELCFSLVKKEGVDYNINGLVSYDKLTNKITIKTSNAYKELMANFGVSESCGTDGVSTKFYTVLIDLPENSTGLIAQAASDEKIAKDKTNDVETSVKKPKVDKKTSNAIQMPATQSDSVEAADTEKVKVAHVKKSKIKSLSKSKDSEDSAVNQKYASEINALLIKNEEIENKIKLSNENVRTLEKAVSDLQFSIKKQSNLSKANTALNDLSDALQSEKSNLNEVAKKETVKNEATNNQVIAPTESPSVTQEDTTASAVIDTNANPTVASAELNDGLPLPGKAPEIVEVKKPVKSLIKPKITPTNMDADSSNSIYYYGLGIGAFLLSAITAFILLMRRRKQKNEDRDDEDYEIEQADTEILTSETAYLNDDEYDHDDKLEDNPLDTFIKSPETVKLTESVQTPQYFSDKNVELPHTLFTESESVISFDMGDDEKKVVLESPTLKNEHSIDFDRENVPTFASKPEVKDTPIPDSGNLLEFTVKK